MRFIPRLSLLARFSLLSVVTMAVIAVLLARFLQTRVEDRAVAGAKETAQTIVQTAVLGHIAPGDWRGHLSEQRLDTIDGDLDSENVSGLGVAAVELYSPQRRVVYASERREVGKPGDDELDEVFDHGTVLADLTEGIDDSGTGDRTIEVYMP